MAIGLALPVVLAGGCGTSADHGGQETASAPIVGGGNPSVVDGGERETAAGPHRLGRAAAGIGSVPAAGADIRTGASALDPGAAGTVVAHATTGRVVAYRDPDIRSEIIDIFQHPVERGGPLVFQAVDRADDGWVPVLLPIRPNGTLGWVRLEDVELTINPYRIEVDADSYRLTIYRYGREQLTTTIAVGNGATPTPIGDFYLIELLRPSDPNGLYGPFAYGLSGYSDTLESFNGGQGVIGIHGTNRPDLLGGDVSHGCIRVANPTITEMTEFLPLGTPVSIFRGSSADRVGAAGVADVR